MSNSFAAAITKADTSTNERDRVEWSRSTILGFIEDYRRERVLWDPNTKGYHIKQTKYEALKALGFKYGTEIRSIRSKIKSLRSSFHREHGKVINGRRRGVDYQPMWFAYEAIRFILDGESSSNGNGCGVVTLDGSGSVVGIVNAAAADDDADILEEKFLNTDGSGSGAIGDGEGGEDDEAEEEEDKHIDTDAAADLKVVTRDLKSAALAAAAAAAALNKPTTMSTTTAQTAAATTTIATPLNATTSTHAAVSAAAAYAADCNSNNIVARVAAAVAAAAATIRSSTNDEFAVSRTDFDGDLQNYFCNISADDVKTELIESDSPDLAMVVRPMRLSTPSPINYSKQSDSMAPTTTNRKRKSHTQIDSDDLPTPSKHQLQHNQHHQHQQHHQQQQHSNSSHARQRDLSPTGAVNNATTSTSSSNNAHHTKTSTPSDEYGVFGEYVAITIRKLKTSKAKIVVKHLINNLLYEAELGKYDHGIPASKEPPQLYKLG